MGNPKCFLGCYTIIRPREARAEFRAQGRNRSAHLSCFEHALFPVYLFAERESLRQPVLTLFRHFRPNEWERIKRMADEWGEAIIADAEQWGFEDKGDLIATLLRVETVEPEGMDPWERYVFAQVDGLDDPEKQVYVNKTFRLDGDLDKHVGHRVRIRWNGKQDLKNGQTMNLYTVWCADCAKPQVG